MDLLAGTLMALAVALFFWPSIRNRLYSGQWQDYSWQVSSQREGQGLSGLLASFGAVEMDKLCRQAGRPNNLTGQRFLIIQGFLAASVTVVMTPLVGLLFGLVMGAGAWYIARFWLKSKADERIRQIELELPTFLDLWSLIVTAGDSIEAALVEIVRHHQEWVVTTEMRLVLDRVAASGLLGESLVAGARETGSLDLIAVCEQVRQLIDGGGSPSKELARTAERMRQERMSQLNKAAGIGATMGIFPKLFTIFLSLAPVIATIILTVMEQI